MPEWSEQSVKFDSKGLDLTHTLDQIPEQAYSFFSNATTVYEGSVTGRPGLTEIMTTPDAQIVTAIRSLYTPKGDGIFINYRIVGAGPNLYWGLDGTLTAVPAKDTVTNTGWTGWGAVVSMVPWRPTKVSQAWMYCMDGGLGRKIHIDNSGVLQCYGIGIQREFYDFITAADVTLAGGGHLEAGDYDWRYTYYNSILGVESNPNQFSEGEVKTATVDQAATITVVKSQDAQVDTIRLYRRGGTLADWYWVKDYPMPPAAAAGETMTVVDDMSCADVEAQGIILSEDNDKPFTSIDQSGEPTYGMPMQVLFGPYMGKYMFALGDVNRPGHLYWTNPFNPDAASSANVIEVSPPSEPLLNGCIYNGKVYVFTKTNVYCIYPSMNGGDTFVVLPLNSGSGLWAQHALCVGPKIWFLGKRGIYEFAGDVATNITDTSLIRPIFYGETVNTHPPIDWDNWDYFRTMRMEYEDPYLHFIYPTPSGGTVALHYHTQIDRWEPWNINLGGSIQPRSIYFEEQTRKFFVGSSESKVFEYSGYKDNGNAIVTLVGTAFFDQGKPRQSKWYGDAFIEFEPNGTTVTVTPYINENTIIPMMPQTLPFSGGRQRAIIPIRNSSNAYGAIQARSIAFAFQWSCSTGHPTLHELNIGYLERPVERTIRETDWDDAGHPVEKYVMGLVIDCDTGNSAKTITIQGDGLSRVYAMTIPAPEVQVGPNQPNRRIVELSWPWFAAKQLRIVTSDTDPWHIYNITWIFEKQPPGGISKWDTVWSDLDWPYEKYIKGVSIECDTYDQEKTIQLRIDGRDDIAVVEFKVQTNGKNIYMHHFDNILAREVKLVAVDENPGQLFNVRWVWDREPVNILVQQTQEATFQSKGFLYMREFYIGLRSTDVVAFEWTVDNVMQYAYNIPSTNGQRSKPKVELPAVKGKNFKFKFVSCEPFKIYLEDSEVRLKEWNADLGWKVYQLPFEGGIENP